VKSIDRLFGRKAEAAPADAGAWRRKRPGEWSPYDRAMRTVANGERRLKVEERPTNCDVNERTGNGTPVGRCCFYAPGMVCPRHGDLTLIPSRTEMP